MLFTVMKKYYKICYFIVLTLLFSNCDKEAKIPTTIVEHDFVWRGFNLYYLWQSAVPDLADNRFSNQGQLNNFLDGFSSPEEVFENLLNKPLDRFSWIVDDYIALENAFQGNTLSNGMEFKLFYETGSDTNAYGVVISVAPNSDAEMKGVLRGMIFKTVDGSQITNSNYKSLLFGSNSDYTIEFANFNGGNPILNGNTISLTAFQLQENPVAIVKTFDEGSHKIGYLLYNQFASSYDGELNAAFGTFKANGITDLIVDLRYNGGGSVRTATYLGSMIATKSNETLFSQQVWNEKVMKNRPASDFLNYFTNNIRNTDENGTVILEEPINSLNLSSVYFIVTDNSASASELVINALKAYIDVTLVGTQTYGKQVGSITVYDSENYARNGLNLNPNHTYAMQPIVLEIKNSKGENAPGGYTPEIDFPEDFGQLSGNINLGVLGEKSEPLLNETINEITNNASRGANRSTAIKKEQLTNSKLQRPFANEMYVEFKK
jgi:carboxyl-terminal processing protease